MKVVLFGASGMVGGGVLLECLDAPEIDRVLVVGRTPIGVTHEKLTHLLVDDLFTLSEMTRQLQGYDACFYCVGVTSAGMSEEAYRRITYDLTVSVAQALLSVNPDIVFCFVSGQGTDGSGRGRVMWARVKGQAENWLRALPNRVYVFRPGFIQPLRGVRSSTTLYRVVYAAMAPLTPLLLRLFPGLVTTTVEVGRAMIRAAVDGYPREVLETRDIGALGRRPS